MTRWIGPLTLTLALALGWGCGGAEETGEADGGVTQQDAVAVTDTTDEVAEDTWSDVEETHDVAPRKDLEPLPMPDVEPEPDSEGPPGTEPDAEPMDVDPVEDTSAPPWDPTPCDADEDCPDGPCVSTPDGGVCSTTCVEECPEGWSCEPVQAGADVMLACVYLAMTHCDPCIDDLACAHPLIDGYGARCLTADPAEGAFCRVPCDEAPCPDGSGCQETEVGGETLLLCFPTAGQSCGCSPLAIAAGATTVCEQGDSGLCVGERSCTEDGLSPCDVPAGGDELCDGLDNDCDTQIDEGLVYEGPDGTAVVGWGLPCGKGGCSGGVTICGDDGGLICSTAGNAGADDDCDGDDDDCDGASDEGFTSGQVTTCGTGACVAEGTVACFDGLEEEDCTPLEASSDETCNEVDDDCDGITDESMPLEICNDIDDDCDGEIDEASDTTVPETCNGADDDCDGIIDEGMPDQDSDGIYDCADEDIDGDTVLNAEDNCPVDANEDQADDDDDGLGDVCDAVGAGEACGGLATEDVILVTTTEDELSIDGDCSLREAILSANTDIAVDACKAGAGDDVISLGTGGASYGLLLAGVGDDANQTGDYDIHSVVTIYGCGAEVTKVTAGELDRIFHVHPEGSLTLHDMTLSGGRVVGGGGQVPAGGVGAGFGGAIYNAGVTTLQGCSLLGNTAVGGLGSDGGHAPDNGGGGGGGAGLGGAIYSTGTLTIGAGTSACLFESNVAQGGTGGKGKFHVGVTPYTGNGGGGGGPEGGAGGFIDVGLPGGFGGGGGGGGGKSCGSNCGAAGGDGGFGGGGGGGGGSSSGGNGGVGGAPGFGGGVGGQGCCSAAAGGGGGGGLGGGIFNDGGALTVGVCTFQSNQALGGAKGSNHFGGTPAVPGGGYGGALFDLDATSSVAPECTFTGNVADTEGQDTYQSVP